MASSDDQKAMDDVREEADGEVTNTYKTDRDILGYHCFYIIINKIPIFFMIFEYN